LLTIIGLAVALAMDALAVSIASGAYLQKVNGRQFFRLSWHFGLFQAIMPVIGWHAGISVRKLIESYDHWIAFLLLAIVATGMLHQAAEEEETAAKSDPTRGWRLVTLSVATSIDALAVGLSLSVIGVTIWLPAGVIGLTAALLTFLGLLLGSRAVRIGRLKRYAQTTGAMLLYIIGLYILYEHGVFASIPGN